MSTARAKLKAFVRNTPDALLLATHAELDAKGPRATRAEVVACVALYAEIERRFGLSEILAGLYSGPARFGGSSHEGLLVALELKKVAAS